VVCGGSFVCVMVVCALASLDPGDGDVVLNKMAMECELAMPSIVEWMMELAEHIVRAYLQEKQGIKLKRGLDHVFAIKSINKSFFAMPSVAGEHKTIQMLMKHFGSDVSKHQVMPIVERKNYWNAVECLVAHFGMKLGTEESRAVSE